MLAERMNTVRIAEVKYCSQGIIKTSANPDYLENFEKWRKDMWKMSSDLFIYKKVIIHNISS